MKHYILMLCVKLSPEVAFGPYWADEAWTRDRGQIYKPGIW
jgi:hypothetical protein